MTIQMIKEFGEYIGFDSKNKCWLYAVNNKYFIINRSGTIEL